MLCFLLNLSITPLPAEELNELYAAFLTEFVCHLLAWAPEEDLSLVSYQTCSVLPLSKIERSY